jgi:cell wall-associated NlpC family hydrolase
MIALEPTRIVDAARAYLGVPHHHQGRHRVAGLDCVGLLLAVAQDIGAEWHDLEGYSRSGAETADLMGYSLLRSHMARSLDEIPIEQAGPGDVWLFWVERMLVPHHVAIVTNSDRMIHAAARLAGGRPGRVVEVPLGRWKDQIDSAWRFRAHG